MMDLVSPAFANILLQGFEDNFPKFIKYSIASDLKIGKQSFPKQHSSACSNLAALKTQNNKTFFPFIKQHKIVWLLNLPQLKTHKRNMCIIRNQLEIISHHKVLAKCTLHAFNIQNIDQRIIFFFFQIEKSNVKCFHFT